MNTLSQHIFSNAKLLSVENIQTVGRSAVLPESRKAFAYLAYEHFHNKMITFSLPNMELPFTACNTTFSGKDLFIRSLQYFADAWHWTAPESVG